MSYEIIRSISAVKNPENPSEYIMQCVGASSNVYPRTFSKFTWGKGKGLTKEEIEKEILWSFFNGEFQKGSSVYKRVIEQTGNFNSVLYNSDETWAKYRKLDRVLNKVLKKYWHTDKDTKRCQQLDNLLVKLGKIKKENVTNILYKYFLQYKAENKTTSNKVKPFKILRVSEGAFLTGKVTITKWGINIYSNANCPDGKIYTSKRLRDYITAHFRDLKIVNV